MAISEYLQEELASQYEGTCVWITAPIHSDSTFCGCDSDYLWSSMALREMMLFETGLW
jgi:hypothetical protein